MTQRVWKCCNSYPCVCGYNTGNELPEVFTVVGPPKPGEGVGVPQGSLMWLGGFTSGRISSSQPNLSPPPRSEEEEKIIESFLATHKRLMKMYDDLRAKLPNAVVQGTASEAVSKLLAAGFEQEVLCGGASLCATPDKECVWHPKEDHACALPEDG
jgi:hypothetical protein